MHLIRFLFKPIAEELAQVRLNARNHIETRSAHAQAHYFLISRHRNITTNQIRFEDGFKKKQT